MQCISNLHHLELCHCGFSCGDGRGLLFLLLDRWTITGFKKAHTWPCSVNGKSTKLRKSRFNLTCSTDCTCSLYISLYLLPLSNRGLFSCSACRVPACARRTRVVKFSRSGFTAANRKRCQVINLLHITKTIPSLITDHLHPPWISSTVRMLSNCKSKLSVNVASAVTNLSAFFLIQAFKKRNKTIRTFTYYN